MSGRDGSILLQKCYSGRGLDHPREAGQRRVCQLAPTGERPSVNYEGHQRVKVRSILERQRARSRIDLGHSLLRSVHEKLGIVHTSAQVRKRTSYEPTNILRFTPDRAVGLSRPIVASL